MIDEIVVMMAPGHLDAVRAIVRTGGYDKVTQILEGGASTRNEHHRARALEALGDEDCKVLFHDAVRPLLSARGSSPSASRRCERTTAVDVAIPSADTIIEVDPDRTTSSGTIPDRATAPPRPDAAGVPARRVIRAAYERAVADPDFTRHRRLQRGAALPARRADLGRRGRASAT